MSCFPRFWADLAKKGVSLVTVLVFFCASLSTTGCYRSRNVVTMEPLDTKVPVSASGQYVDAGGRVVTEDEYDVLTSFNFERTVEAPRHKKSQTDLEIEAEIDRIVAQAGGEAVTDFKLEGADYDSGGHGPAAGWKILGWSFGLMGATFLITSAAIGDPDLNAVFYPIGGIFAGVGLLSFGLAWTARKPTEWRFNVAGNVVSRGGSDEPPVATLGPTPEPTEVEEEAEPEDEPEGGATPPAPRPADDDAIDPMIERSRK